MNKSSHLWENNPVNRAVNNKLVFIQLINQKNKQKINLIKIHKNPKVRFKKDKMMLKPKKPKRKKNINKKMLKIIIIKKQICFANPILTKKYLAKFIHKKSSALTYLKCGRKITDY
jgi:hypothetical protein